MENRLARRKATQRYDLIDLAIELGYTPKKVGRSYYTLAEHDSVRINVEKNSFNQYSTGAYGDSVSFLMTFGENIDTRFKSLDYSIRYLEKQLRITPDKRVDLQQMTEKKRDPLILPKEDKENQKVFSYLRDTRCINENIVNFFLENKWLYQSADYKNCVFVSYKDKKPVFATERGTSPYKRFMKEFSGNDYNHCFYINNNSDYLIVTESIIDMMSVMTLNKRTDIHKKHNFLSINSVQKDAAIYTHLKNNPKIDCVSLLLDNDEAGRAAAKRISAMIKEKTKNVQVMISFPNAKDYNEELVTRTKQDTLNYEIEHSEELQISM